MKITTLVGKAEAEYAKSEADDAKSQATVLSSVRHKINCGEYINQLKVRVDGKWGDWAESNLSFGQAQANRYMRIARHKVQVEALINVNGAMSVHNLVKLIPKASESPVITSALPKELGYVQPQKSDLRDKDDWQTPYKYIESAVKVMGSIDLDPFTSARANGDIGATHIFTVADNGLNQVWNGADIANVWMNPPYSKGLLNKTIDKFVSEYGENNFKQGIILVNCSPDTHWYHQLLKESGGVCQTLGRISFIAGDKTFSANIRGQAFFYFGAEFDKFKAEFNQYGWVVSTEGYE